MAKLFGTDGIRGLVNGSDMTAELAEKMGEQGKKLVKNEFSGDKVAKRFLEEYNKTIANHQNGETKRIGN